MGVRKLLIKNLEKCGYEKDGVEYKLTEDRHKPVRVTIIDGKMVYFNRIIFERKYFVLFDDVEPVYYLSYELIKSMEHKYQGFIIITKEYADGIFVDEMIKYFGVAK